jgi:hypothetical protein
MAIDLQMSPKKNDFMTTFFSVSKKKTLYLPCQLKNITNNQHMSKIRCLHIKFSENIQAYDIPKFRAAVIEKTKRESDLFHNHVDETKFIYRYPLIQYKVCNRKASLLCLNEATEDIHYLLRQRNFDFRIGSKTINYEIDDVRLKYERIQTWEEDFRYNMLHWMALNQENYEAFKQKESIVERVSFLEDILMAHLRIFMEGVGATETVPLRASILEIKEEKHIEYKKVFHLCFTVNFKTNLSIPNYAGLGKGVSIGFGIVKKLGDNRYDRHKNYNND